MECVSGDEKLAELITRYMKMYEEIVDGYDFKTEQLHIDLVAAVNTSHKAEDDMDKGDLAGKFKIHRVVPAKIDFDKLAPYFLYSPHSVIRKTLENTTQLAKAVINTLLRRHLKSRFSQLYLYCVATQKHINFKKLLSNCITAWISQFTHHL